MDKILDKLLKNVNQNSINAKADAISTPISEVADANEQFLTKEPVRLLQEIDKKLSKDGELNKRLGLILDELKKGIGQGEKGPKKIGKDGEVEDTKKQKYIPSLKESVTGAFGTAKKFVKGDAATWRNALDATGLIKKGAGTWTDNALARKQMENEHVQNRKDVQGTTFGTEKSFRKEFRKSYAIQGDIEKTDKRITELRKAGYKEEQIKRGGHFKKATELNQQLGEADIRYRDSFGGPKTSFGDKRNIIVPKEEAPKPKKAAKAAVIETIEEAPKKAPKRETKKAKEKSYGDHDNLEMAKLAGHDNVADWYKETNIKAMSDDPKVAKQAQIDLKAYEKNKAAGAEAKPKKAPKKAAVIETIEQPDDLAPTKKAPKKETKKQKEMAATQMYWEQMVGGAAEEPATAPKRAKKKPLEPAPLALAAVPAAEQSSGIGPADTTEQENEAIKREEQTIDLLVKIEENTRKDKIPEKKEQTDGGGMGLGAMGLAALAAVAGAVFGLVKGYVKIIKEVLTKVFETVKGIFEGVGKFFAEKFGKLKQIFGEKIALVGEYIAEQFGKLKKLFNIGEDSKIAKFITSMIEGVKSGIGKLFTPIEKARSLLSKAGEFVGKGVEFVKDFVTKITEFFGNIGGKLGNFGKIFKKVAGIFEKLAWPLMVIMAVWDTVKGFIEGFKKDGIVGGIKGAIVGLFDSLIGGILDMLKDAASWILEKLGFEDAAKFLDSFSFTDMFKDIIDAIFKPIMGVVDLVKQAFGKFGEGDIMGGIEDIMKSIQSILLMPVDLVKDAISWILDKLGFEDASKFLDSFNFADIAKTITEAIFHPFDTIKNLFNKLIDWFQNIEIPEIGFTIPVINKKVSVGPFHPFKKEDAKSTGTEDTGKGASGGSKTSGAAKPKEGTEDWMKVNKPNIDSWTKAVQSGSQKIESVPPVYKPYVEKALADSKPTKTETKAEPKKVTPPKEGSEDWMKINKPNIDSWIKAVQAGSKTIEEVPAVYKPYVEKGLTEVKTEKKDGQAIKQEVKKAETPKATTTATATTPKTAEPAKATTGAGANVKPKTETDWSTGTGGEKMNEETKAKIMKMPDADAKQAIAAWKVLTDPKESATTKAGAGELLNKLIEKNASAPKGQAYSGMGTLIKSESNQPNATNITPAPSAGANPNLKPAEAPSSGNQIAAMSNENAAMATTPPAPAPAASNNNVNVVNSNQSTNIVAKPPIRNEDSTANSYLSRMYVLR